MASISSITLPDNSRYDLKDAKLKGVYSVKGTQNSETSQWTGNIDVDSLTDGLSIAYYLPVGSSDNVTLNLTLANNTTTGPIDVYMTSTKRVGTEYSAGSIVYLTYYNTGSISVNGNLSLAPRWIVSNDLKEKITNAEIDQLFDNIGESGTIYGIMRGATTAAPGSEGFVPAPAVGDQIKFLRGDGLWAVPTDTTYNVMVGATSSAPGQVGLVPAPATNEINGYLKGDGTWSSPIANMTTTDLGGILDATIGKELKDDIDDLKAQIVDFKKVRTLTEGDLNDFTSSEQNGLYYLNGSFSDFVNCPLGYSMLLVLSRATAPATAPSYQICFAKDSFFFRAKTGNTPTWGDWKQVLYSVTNNAPTLAWETTSTIGTVGNTPLTVTMPANPNTTYAFSNGNPTLAWGTKSTVGTVGGTALTVTMPANPNTNTTYTAGKGLALSGNTFRLTIPRVKKTANYLPGQNTVEIEQYESGSTNIPTGAYYHIYTAEGPDTKYATQLALGMSADGAYYRRYGNGTWGSWKSLINTDHTYGNFTAATSAASGTAGLVPAPGSSWYANRGLAFLNATGTWRYLDEAASGVSVNNLTTTAEHHVLDARAGKTLNDSINTSKLGPTTKSISITSLTTASVGATWTTFLSNYTVPSNGFLYVDMGGSTNTPSAWLTVTNGYTVRNNGNGARDYSLLCPVFKGQVVNGACVYGYARQIKLYTF